MSSIELSGLRGKKVLVTGGTTGIGRATAKQLTGLGARVFIFGRHEQELLDALGDIGEGCQGITADQANGEDIARVFADVDTHLGGLDILINNAAVSGESVIDMTYEEMEYAVRANLTGYLECSRLAIERMKVAGQGDIINIGSISAVQRNAGSDVYTATKAGIDGFTTSLRKHVVDDNIRVSLIEPGLVGTDMTAEDSPVEDQPGKIERGEMLKAEDIAQCVLFILGQPRRCDIIHMRVQPHHEDE